MKSKTKIGKQVLRKTNPTLVESIISAKKNEKWLEVSRILSGPRSGRKSLNLREISALAGNSKIVVVTGKVLSEGDIDKKIKVVAFGFSERAKEKLLKSGCEVSYIVDEIKNNPSAKDITILK